MESIFGALGYQSLPLRRLMLTVPKESSSSFSVWRLQVKQYLKNSKLGSMPKYPSNKAIKPAMYKILLGPTL